MSTSAISLLNEASQKIIPSIKDISYTPLSSLQSGPTTTWNFKLTATILIKSRPTTEEHLILDWDAPESTTVYGTGLSKQAAKNNAAEQMWQLMRKIQHERDTFTKVEVVEKGLFVHTIVELLPTVLPRETKSQEMMREYIERLKAGKCTKEIQERLKREFDPSQK